MNFNIIIYPIVMGIGALASTQLTLPLGMEKEFQYFLAPLASFLGYGCANILKDRIRLKSALFIIGMLLSLVFLAVLVLWLYNRMIFSIDTPSGLHLVLEATLFSLMFFLFFFAAGFGKIKAFDTD